MKVSIEILYHLRCDHDPNHWWSVGDNQPGPSVFCPYCGKESQVEGFQNGKQENVLGLDWVTPVIVGTVSPREAIELIRQYRSGEITLGKLAESMGATLEDAIELLRDSGLEVELGCDSIEELEEDIRNA